MIARPRSHNRALDPYTVRVIKRGALYAVLVLGSVFTCFPFVWMILTSFKTYAEAIATPPTVFARDWGQRLGVTLSMLRTYPMVAVAFAAWVYAGYLLRKRIRDRVAAGIYITVHLVLFFLIGNLGLWGKYGLARLWQAAMRAEGIALEPFTGNYVEAWGRAPFLAYFKNSIIMSTLNPLLIILTSAPAAYAFARLQFPAKGMIFMFYLATMMVPSEVILIPNFITVSRLGWRNTYFALVVPYMVSVMSIFFLRQFFRSVPDDLYDAATIDGCGHVRALIYIAMPLARPALVSTAMFNFLGAWNALLWPLLVTDKEDMRTIALGLSSFATEAGMQPQLYMAAATFTIVPVIVLFLFVQRQFIEGIARTGIR